jgi:hypothetical protein
MCSIGSPVGDFSADWLSLREPADAAARSATLVLDLAERLAHEMPVTVLDLGCGTGANCRYVAPKLGADQDWLLADRDEELLARVVLPAVHGRMLRVSTQAVDLADASALKLVEGRRLVTASALLDLVSERWLEALVSACAAGGVVAVLFALTYDGRIRHLPEDPDDALILELVNGHQRRDKGFGPALGPAADEATTRCLAAHGYIVRRAPSDWSLGPDRSALQRALVEGWAGAALESAQQHASRISGWRSRRLRHIDDGRSRMAVGHTDLIGFR